LLDGSARRRNGARRHRQASLRGCLGPARFRCGIVRTPSRALCENNLGGYTKTQSNQSNENNPSCLEPDAILFHLRARPFHREFVLLRTCAAADFRQALRLRRSPLCSSSSAVVTGVTTAEIGSVISTYGNRIGFLFVCDAASGVLAAGRREMGTSFRLLWEFCSACGRSPRFTGNESIGAWRVPRYVSELTFRFERLCSRVN
jgi:hypothetical protein